MGKIILSAFIGGAITSLTALMSALSQTQGAAPLTMETVGLIIGGGMLAALKDIQAYMAKSPL